MRKTTGLSLLLLMFLSLCLIIFSLLSLSGATADETLSQKHAERTTEYYTAVSETNQILAQIDSLLAKELLNISRDEYGSAGASSEIDTKNIECIYLNQCIKAIQSHFPDCATLTENTIHMTFSVPLTEGQILQVSLSIDYPFSPDDPLYQIIGWQVMNTNTWTPDLSQKLYIPN